MKDEKLRQLRQKMCLAGADCVVVYTEDDHAGEYVGAHDQVRAFLTGFTGSAGVAVVSRDKAALFTDGRYFLQAEKQLLGTGFELMRQGEPGVPTPEEYACSILEQGQTLFCDGTTLSCTKAQKLMELLDKKQAKLIWNRDIVGDMWTQRPPRSVTPAWELQPNYSGETREHKLQRVRTAMKDASCDMMAISELNDIAWLLNLRANDVPNTPVLSSFALVYPDKVDLYCGQGAIDANLAQKLNTDSVFIKNYNDLYIEAEQINGLCVLADPQYTNYKLYSCLCKNNQVLLQSCPIQRMKAQKNAIEQDNMRRCHEIEGLAFCRFEKQLKQLIQEGNRVTEWDAVELLEKYRKMSMDYIEPSFSSIVGYGENAAVIHYAPVVDDAALIKPKGFLLCDVGGQYLLGTTDMTRTLAMGPVTQEMKKRYTQVLMGMIDLAEAVYTPNTTGGALDILARGPLFKEQKNFRHGTGHGVGYLLSVHEGPNNIRPGNQEVLLPGMITSDEPGFYQDGEYGIRLEILLLSKEYGESEYGRFMCFEPLTLAPFEREAICKEMLSAQQLAWLNSYHQQVYNRLSPMMNQEEKAWLAERCQKI